MVTKQTLGGNNRVIGLSENDIVDVGGGIVNPSVVADISSTNIISPDRVGGVSAAGEPNIDFIETSGNPFANLPTGSAPAIELAAQQDDNSASVMKAAGEGTELSEDVAQDFISDIADSVDPNVNIIDQAAQTHTAQGDVPAFEQAAGAHVEQDGRSAFEQVARAYETQDSLGMDLDLREQVRAQQPIDQVIVDAAEMYKDGVAHERLNNIGARGLISDKVTLPILPATPMKRGGRGGADMRRR